MRRSKRPRLRRNRKPLLKTKSADNLRHKQKKGRIRSTESKRSIESLICKNRIKEESSSSNSSNDEDEEEEDEV